MADEWISFGSAEWYREIFKDHLSAALLADESPLTNLTATVVGGTFVEFHVRQLISTKADLDLLEKPGSDQHVDAAVLIRMATALKVLQQELKPPLLALMRLRNKFAHEVRYKLTEADITDLWKKSGEDLCQQWLAFEAMVLNDDENRKETPGLRLRCFIACVGDILLDEVKQLLYKDEDVLP